MTIDDDDDSESFYTDDQLSARAQAKKLVRNWRITAVGSRPRDFMVRDLLIASHLRDGRQRLLRHYSKECAPWMGVRTIGVPPKLRKSACQLSALHYLHAMQLFQIVDRATKHERAIIRRLLQCWPTGLLVAKRGPSPRTGKDVCRLARLCPFCFSRQVTRLYQRLDVALEPYQDRTFVLARLNIPGDLFTNRFPTRLDDRCAFVRHRVGSALVDRVRKLGADGGLVTFVVGPRKSTDSEMELLATKSDLEFDFRIAVLGSIAAPTSLLRDLHHRNAPLFAIIR
jgi:hypothetical protein